MKSKGGLVMKPSKVFFCSVFFLFSLVLNAADQGAVDVLVSQEGALKENYEVIIGNRSYKTNEFGFVTVALDAGDHVLNIKNGESSQRVPFKVQRAQRTQLVINLFENDIVSDLNQPEKKVKKKDSFGHETGAIDLKVLSVNGEPVSGAKVYARGTQTSGLTDRLGNVKLRLPLGKQVISITHRKYSTQVVRDLEVTQSDLTMRTVELTPAGLVLEDFVVLAPNLKGSIQALIEVRRKASDVADVMSAEQMSKTGDSDAAGSLKRVTGLTLKDGKYVFVRGLGERYSSTLLNGVSLPSPDPTRRVVPLDLFPVQFLDSMVIQKSYSPNQPGEFGGGVVQLQTKSMPEKFYIKMAMGDTVNSNSGNMQGYQGGSTDWLGVDDGGRKLPEGAAENPNLILQNNRHRLSDENYKTLPEFALSIGDSWKLGPVRMGYTLGSLYKDGINYIEEERNRYSMPEGNLVREDNYVRQKTQKERTVGGIFGYEAKLFKSHSLSLNYINLRNTTDYVAVMQGDNAEGNQIRQTEIEWAARTLKTFMLRGENNFSKLNNLKVSWHFAESKARRDEPNRTQFRYSPNDEGVFVFNPNDNTAYERRYYNLVEQVDDFGGSLESDFPWFYKRQGRLEIGANRTRKTRTSGMVRFALDPSGVPCNTDLSQDLDTIFDQCRDSFSSSNATRATDTYVAGQILNAYYFKTHWPILDKLNLTTGMRYENSVQKVDTISPFDKDAISSQLNMRNWPSWKCFNLEDR